ncbi:hypothetical protein [Collinsella sp. AF31-11]|uniref:hypothetical protein n=1 Tax=Collinsella sp. AF31-11 TaxID=2292011 RepID=UPI000E4EC683|nr:hypothetical protein [Collinsella sp. AF31-11]RHN22689.1 hypothetical protein DWZ22_03265 [Collinsella sp. AF31-11]
MAIQMRRGIYEKFLPKNMTPGEFAVVLSGDPNGKNGTGVYICFSPGSVKQLATMEDMGATVSTMIQARTGDIIAELTEAIDATEKSVKAAESQRETDEAKRRSDEQVRKSNEAQRKKTFDETVASAKRQVADTIASCTQKTDAAAEKALKAAEEANGAVDPNMKIYFTRRVDEAGNSRPVLVDMTMEG